MASSCSEPAAIPPADTAEERTTTVYEAVAAPAVEAPAVEAPAIEAPAVVDSAPEPPGEGAMPAEEWPPPPWISADGSTLACPFSPALSGTDDPHLVFIRAEDGAFLRSIRRDDAAPILARDGYTRLEVIGPVGGLVERSRAGLDVELDEGAPVSPPINARGVLLEGPGRTAITLRDASARARFRATVSNQPPRFRHIPRHCGMSFFADFVLVWVDEARGVVLVDQEWRSGSDECHPWRWVLGRMGGEIVSQLDESHPSLRWMSERQGDE